MIFLLYLPAFLGLIHIIRYVREEDGNIFKNFWLLVMLSCMAGYPAIYYFMLCGGSNDCCRYADPLPLSPSHILSVYVLVALADIAFFVSIYREDKFPPIIEVLINCLLLCGLVLNVFIIIQGKTISLFLSPVFIVIMVYLLIALHRNNTLYRISTANADPYISPVLRLLHSILTANVFIKYPSLLILSLPLLACISLALLLFGQKPDSMIQAFTDTYHTTFSIHDCTGVQCPGHYLCTVAAHGHEELVKPLRNGVRHGTLIKVNRQLLVANAFEEMIEERVPQLHRLIRKHYDKVGDWINHNQQLVSNKWSADLIYYLMKPLEWSFIFTLYLMDKEPENRIAKQYMSSEHKKLLKGG